VTNSEEVFDLYVFRMINGGTVNNAAKIHITQIVATVARRDVCEETRACRGFAVTL